VLFTCPTPGPLPVIVIFGAGSGSWDESMDTVHVPVVESVVSAPIGPIEGLPLTSTE